MSIKNKDKIIISEKQLSIICVAFQKWFRVADCKDEADVDMWKAMNKLDEKEYGQAMRDSLREANVVVKDLF